MALTLLTLSAVLSLAAAGDFLQPFPAAGITFPVGLVTGKANVPLGTKGVVPALSVPVIPHGEVYPAPLSAKHLLPGTPAVQGFPASAITGNSYVAGLGLGNAAFKAANFPVFPAQQTVAVDTVPKVVSPAVSKVVVGEPVTRTLYNSAPGLAAFPRTVQKAVAAAPFVAPLGFGNLPLAQNFYYH